MSVSVSTPARSVLARHVTALFKTGLTAAAILAMAAASTVVATTAASASTTAGHSAVRPAAKATPATPATVNTGKIYFGVDGTVSQAAAGQDTGRHLYGELTNGVPNARMVTMGITGLDYATIAAAQPGSVTYTNIVRWADTIKARATLTFFGFVHEPETTDQAHFGTATQYIAAYQHVVDIFRAQNVTNAQYVWQLTAYAFVRKDSSAAINYYPGDTYVDDVAADAYNWAGCGPGGPQRDLSVIANPVLAFAEAHNKLAILAEFGSQTGPLRAAWLASAQQYLIQNDSEVQAAFYFDRPPTTPKGADCNWSLTSTADVAAFRAIVNDTTYFTN